MIHKSSSGIKCPNHLCPLLDIGEGRRMQCPVSTAIFEVEIDLEEKTEEVDKFGRKIITYRMEGDENG